MLTLVVLKQDQDNEYIFREETSTDWDFNYLHMLAYCHFKKSSFLKCSDGCS